MEGPSLTRTTSPTFQTYLQTALGAYQTQISAQMQSRLQRQEEVRLRQEQDSEYEAALEADRKRDVERAEEAARAAEEAERIAMEVEAVQNEKETILMEAQSLLEERGEPQVGERCCKIRLVLPTGQKLLRNFHPNDTVQVVRAFLIVYFEQQEVDISNFGLCMNYPKKDLVEEYVTLESEGLCPQAVIMVQDLDA
jgi:FAS-associated factor 2